MKIFWFSALLLLCVAHILHADEMKVLSVKGKVTVSGSRSSAVRTGMRLIPSDKITLSSKSSVSLLHTGGKVIELSTAGSYKVSELISQASQKGSALTKKFASYVYGELTDTDDSPLSDSHKKNMQTTGSVERATGDRQSNVDALEEMLHASGVNTGNNSLSPAIKNSAESILTEDFVNIIMPRSCYLIDPDVMLQWNKLNAASGYRVEFVDSQDHIVFSTLTNDTAMRVNLLDKKLQRGVNYYWTVRRDDKPSVHSTQYCVQICTEDRAQALRDTLGMIQNEENSNPSFGHIIQAQFAEDKGLQITAIDNYRAALSISNNEDYKRYFRNYLRRINLYQESSSVK